MSRNRLTFQQDPHSPLLEANRIPLSVLGDADKSARCKWPRTPFHANPRSRFLFLEQPAERNSLSR